MTTPDEIATKNDIRAVMLELEEMKRLLAKVTITAPPRWITIQEYAGRVGKSVPTVRRWIRNGQVETKGSLLRNPDV